MKKCVVNEFFIKNSQNTKNNELFEMVKKKKINLSENRKNEKRKSPTIFLTTFF